MSVVTSLFSKPKQPQLPPPAEPPKVPTKDTVSATADKTSQRRAGAVGRKETILTSPKEQTKKTVLGG